MPTSIKLEKCVCGTKEKYGYRTKRFGLGNDHVLIGYTFCPKSRFWNFWKHDKKVEHSYQSM